MSKTKNHKRCPFCDFTVYHTKKLISHLNDAHGYKNPQNAYVKAYHGGVHPLCACGCGERLPFNGWSAGFSRMIRGHNGNIYNVHSQERADEIIKSRKEKLKGRESWSKGLTKETDDRIAKRSMNISQGWQERISSGEHRQWNKGLTKETDKRVARNVVAAQRAYDDGTHAPWLKGLTKETDDRLARLAKSVKKAHNDPTLRAHLDAQKLLSRKHVIRRIKKQASGFHFNEQEFEYEGQLSANISLSCKTCGKTKVVCLATLNNRCYQCHPSGSDPQVEIHRYVQSIGFTPVSTRTVIAPLEIDIYIEEKKFGIEYDSLWWHCEGSGSSYDRHSKKTAYCNEKGIRLLHIFGDEWDDKNDIVKSMISARLGLSQNRVGARQCSICELQAQDRKTFFNENHIEGDVHANVAFGLIGPDGSMLSALSLREPFHRGRKDHIEIARFACKIHHNIPGGLGRLFKQSCKWASKNGYKTIMTYVDERLGDGHGYKCVGMKHIKTTVERFWWTDCRQRYNRFKFKANKELGLSQKQVAKKAKVYRIWGCKNRLYSYSLITPSFSTFDADVK